MTLSKGTGLVLTLAVLASWNAIAAAPQATAPRQGPQYINMTEPWPYPFSSAVRTGNLLFVSGQIGSKVQDGAPVLVPGGI